MPRFLTRGELEDRRGAAEISRLSAGSDPAVDSAIESGEAEAVSYLLSRYGSRLPATPAATPGVLKDKVAVLVHRHLARGAQVSQTLVDEARDARAWFSQASRGIVSLDLPDAAAQLVDRSGPLILTNAREDDPPPLSFETLKGW